MQNFADYAQVSLSSKSVGAKVASTLWMPLHVLYGPLKKVIALTSFIHEPPTNVATASTRDKSACLHPSSSRLNPSLSLGRFPTTARWGTSPATRSSTGSHGCVITPIHRSSAT